MEATTGGLGNLQLGYEISFAQPLYPGYLHRSMKLPHWGVSCASLFLFGPGEDFAHIGPNDIRHVPKIACVRRRQPLVERLYRNADAPRELRARHPQRRDCMAQKLLLRKTGSIFIGCHSFPLVHILMRGLASRSVQSRSSISSVEPQSAPMTRSTPGRSSTLLTASTKLSFSSSVSSCKSPPSK